MVALYIYFVIICYLMIKIVCYWGQIRYGPSPNNIKLIKGSHTLILGQGGSGKSALATLLSEKNNIPIIRLDSLKFEAPGWKRRSFDEFKQNYLNLSKAYFENGFILEGILSDPGAPEIERYLCELIRQGVFSNIIVVRTPVHIRVYRILRRSFYRFAGREPQGSGGKESLKGIWTMLKNNITNDIDNQIKLNNLPINNYQVGLFGGIENFILYHK